MRASLDQHFHTRIQRQGSLEAAGQVMAECAEALGWGLIGFLLDNRTVSLPRTRSGDPIAHTMGWPKPVLEQWRKLGRHCPIAERCSKTTDPFAWDCELEPSRWFGMDLQPAQRQVLDHYARCVSVGITVPVPLPDGRTGVVSWCARDRGSLEQLYADTFGSTFLLSHTFVRHAHWLNDGADAGTVNLLSPRERECLTWAARGKSEEEIGIILGRSQGTVHFHLRNALVKLDAGNRAHAVAIACSRGLISLDTPPSIPKGSATIACPARRKLMAL